MIRYLGKLPPQHDPLKRTITLKSILKVAQLPPLPDKPWTFAALYPQFDLSPQTWGNLDKGDCVEVGSSAQIRDWEVIQEGIVIPVTEDEVVSAYMTEAGGQDEGLVMLDHMKYLKNNGVVLGGRLRKIDAFVRIDVSKQHQIMYSKFLAGLGCSLGFSLPDNWQDAVNAGGAWSDVSLAPNPDNGHCMMPGGWTGMGPNDFVLLWTWGQWMQATWEWVMTYLDEGWAMVAYRDQAVDVNSPLDIPGLEEQVAAVSKL